MATSTTNLALIKPAGTDKIRIAQINSNMDVLDAKIGPVGQTSLQAQLNTKLDKTGGTITGNLIIDGNTNYMGMNINGASGSPTVSIRNTGQRMTIDSYANGSAGGERFLLPIPEATDTDKWYFILTSKAPVAVAQGGTGAVNAAGARANLGITPANIGAPAAYRQSWGTSMTFPMNSGQQALVSLSAQKVFIIWKTGSGTSVTYLAGADADITYNNESSNITVKYNAAGTVNFAGMALVY